MSTRLRQISLSGTGLVASQNKGCIVNDSDSGFLMESNGTGWTPYMGPALGVFGENTDSIPAGPFNGATLYDPSYGFVYSNGTSWQVPARDLEHEIGLQHVTPFGLSSAQSWACPRMPGGTLALTGTATATIGTIYFYPFTVPSIGTSVGLATVSYKVTTGDNTAQVFATQATGTGPFTIPSTPTLTLNGVSIPLVAGALTATALEALITAAAIPGLGLALSGQQVVMTMAIYQSLVIAGGAPTLTALGLTAGTTAYAGPGAAMVGVYGPVSSANQFPTAQFQYGSTAESATGIVTCTFGLQSTYPRGTRVWLAYLRQAGVADLECQGSTHGPGDLGYVNNGLGTMVANDVLTCSGTPFLSLPGTVAPNSWTPANVVAAPQLYVSFSS